MNTPILTEQSNTETAYPIGLALSGGGARGFAHMGALKALEEEGIKPNLLSGVSAGSIVGALYADGYSPDEMLELFAGLSFTDLAQLTLPRSGFFKMDGFRSFLRKHLHTKRLEKLPIPLLITATNLDKGESVTFDKGDIIEVIAASCCIPVIFSPVEIAGELYVDGGVIRNFPVTPIRHLCKQVIGVNVNPFVADVCSRSVIGIAERSFNYMMQANAIADMALCDILIETDEIEQFSLFDLENLRAIAALGYDDTKQALARYNNKQIETN